MSTIWNLIRDNPGPVLDLLGGALVLLGVGKWRRNVKESTAAQVDRWTSTAVGVVVLLIRAGYIKSIDGALERFLVELREAAADLGIQIKPEHEHRALGTAKRHLAAIGVELATEQMQHVAGLIDAMSTRMAKLPWPKAAPPGPPGLP